MKKHKKFKIVIGIILFVLLIAAAVIIYYLNFYEEDLNERLPMTTTVKDEDSEPEDIAYRFWFDYMQAYKGENVSSWQRLADVRYNEFQLLAGDESEFAVGVTFWAILDSKNWSTHRSWGDVQEDGTIEDIEWTLRIEKTGDNEYTLKRIDETSNATAGLAPLEDTYQKEAGIDVPDEKHRHRIADGNVEITYDGGDNWQEVPARLEEFFKGDYNGPKHSLIDGSYVISPDKTAFVIGGGRESNLHVLQSNDMGETWDEVDISTPFPAARMRLIGFTSEQDGYLIVTGGRTMSAEGHLVFKTNDGGKNWEQTGSADTSRMLTSGGFINDSLGFLSFGAERRNDQPPLPSLYRTEDGGENWNRVEVPIPAEYHGIFTIAEVPTFDGSQGTLLISQGPNGDYQGGNVKARFVSVDDGATWSFANLVDPDDVIEE
ncbi:hypothetical protein KFZ58_17860 [Virgibacillus sp. NKC19-16]|uniref:WD40/YVTN/BNR-like repeat-containing protein n=1 Tax=Virgibacillus salidurans TaxID=2831673 RepID=UPI001F3709A7|nr:sialidase family protein [Virgibacillus sp. NKC19-16]UJL46195.1 hypothetical protein KFZ58_17860 [Virgibacillus sp. NKC19-16]